MSGWGGRKAKAWTDAVLERYGRQCQLRLHCCTGIATTGDHVIPKSVRPDLRFDVTNGRPACRACNASRGTQPLSRVVAVDERTFFENVHSGGRQTFPVSPPVPQKMAEGDRP